MAGGDENTTEGSEPPEELTLFHDEEIEVPFSIGEHRLIPGCEGVLGDPIEEFLELFAVSPGRISRVRSPTDLARITVAVADSAQALEFVRLFTSPKTQHLFDGRGSVLELPGSVHEGVPGPRITEDAEGFSIKRCLVLRESLSAEPRAVIRTERVTRDGGYEPLGDVTLPGVDARQFDLPERE